MQDLGSDQTPRKRALRVEVVQARAALTLVRPVYVQIGPWQVAAARLTGMAERIAARGQDATSTLKEIEALLATVAAGRVQMRAEAERAPRQIAAHSRLNDTLRALDSLIVSLERAKALLQAKRTLS